MFSDSPLRYCTTGASGLAEKTMRCLLGSMPAKATVQVVSFGACHEYLAPAPMIASDGVVAEVYRAIADNEEPWGTTGTCATYCELIVRS